MNALRLVALASITLACCSLPVAASAQVPTADDFLPPVSGGPTDVKQPDQLALAEQTVTAVTAQDAMNAAVKKNVQELADGDTAEVGAKMVKFPSGLGFVASGVATYRTGRLRGPVAVTPSRGSNVLSKVGRRQTRIQAARS